MRFAQVTRNAAFVLLVVCFAIIPSQRVFASCGGMELYNACDGASFQYATVEACINDMINSDCCQSWCSEILGAEDERFECNSNSMGTYGHCYCDTECVDD